MSTELWHKKRQTGDYRHIEMESHGGYYCTEYSHVACLPKDAQTKHNLIDHIAGFMTHKCHCFTTLEVLAQWFDFRSSALDYWKNCYLRMSDDETPKHDKWGGNDQKLIAELDKWRKNDHVHKCWMLHTKRCGFEVGPSDHGKVHAKLCGRFVDVWARDTMFFSL